MLCFSHYTPKVQECIGFTTLVQLDALTRQLHSQGDWNNATLYMIKINIFNDEKDWLTM